MRGPKKRKLRELEEELKQLDRFIRNAQKNGNDYSIEKDRRVAVVEEIKILKRKIRAVPL